MVETMIRAASLCAVWTLVATCAAAGESRCWFENGAVVVPAAFGQISGDFIVDLSQAHSQVHETSARTAGIVADDMRGVLRIAGERVDGFPASIADLDARAAGFTTNIAGVLGADAFRPFVLELSLAPCRLRLNSPASGATSRTARLQLRSFAGRPTIRAAVADAVEGREGWFALDTASSISRIADARLSRMPRAPNTPVRLRALALAGGLFEQVPAGLLERQADGTAGAIGTAVLSHFTLRLDQRRGWLDLYPAP